jgi:hypothetical protein
MDNIGDIDGEQLSGVDGKKGQNPCDKNDPSIKKTLMIAGCLYLTFILFSFVADSFAVFVMKDPDTVINRMIDNEWLFSFGLVSNLFSALFFILAAWALYVLLKPVNKNLALSFLILNLIGVAIQCMAVNELFSAVQLLSGAEFLDIIQAEQLHAQALFHIKMYGNGIMIAQLFFGAWLLPLGYLVYRSKFLPKWLGILLMVDFLAIVTWFFQFFLFPGNEILNALCLGVSLIAEFGLCGLLIVKGIWIPRRKNCS